MAGVRDDKESGGSQLTIRVEQIKDLLQVDQQSIRNDIRQAFADFWTVHPNSGVRLAWPTEDAAFQHWFEMRCSGVLAVDGLQEKPPTVTPTTYFSGIASGNLILDCPSLEHVPLMYFCGMHAKPGDSLEGASGMMRSLAFQLLGQKQDSDLPFFKDDILDQIGRHTLSELCGLFFQLVMTAPATTIICVIDGLSSDTIGIGSNAVFNCLQLLITCTKEDRPKVEFKLLLSGPEAFQIGEKWFTDVDHTVMGMMSSLSVLP